MKRPVQLRDTSHDYYSMNASTHRSAPTNFGPPALTWHRAFWVSPPYAGERIFDAEELKKHRQTVKRRLDTIILAYLSALHDQAQWKDRGDKGNSGQTAPEFTAPVFRPMIDGATYCLFGTLVTRGRVGGRTIFRGTKPKTQRSQQIFESDNRVVQISHFWRGIQIRIRIELHTEYFTVTAFAEGQNFDRIQDADFKKAFEDLAKYFCSPDDPALAGTLNSYLMHNFWVEYLTSLARAAQFRAKVWDPKIFTGLFADFRGLVVTNDFGKIIAPDFGESEDLQWAKRIHKKLRLLFRSGQRYECAANYVLDGRAAYFSLLGVQTPTVTEDVLIPLEYVVYVHEGGEEEPVVNMWQLARLIDRLHTLGTVRLAALKYLPALRDAGSELAQLDAYVKRARAAIVPEPGKKEKGLRVESADDLKKAHHIFGAITTNFNNATETNSGLLYRIERSRYYVRQFRSSLVGLRIRRIEGYSPYDQFVQRRIGPAFDFVNRLGTRYERAVSTFSLLDQFYLSMRTNEIDNDVRRIQLVGETALWGAVVPYHLIGILHYIVVEEALPLMAISIWLGFFFIAGMRFAELSPIKFQMRERGFKFMMGLAVMALLALVLFGFGKTGQLKLGRSVATHSSQSSPPSFAGSPGSTDANPVLNTKGH